jgi:hypothetical protein
VRQKGFAPILVILLVLIAIGGAYYLGTKKGNILPVSTQTPVSVATNISTQASPTAKPSADPTASWKTYTNAEFGFSVKYPPGMQISASPNDPNNSFVDFGNVLALFFSPRRESELALVAENDQQTLQPVELPIFMFEGQTFKVTKTIFGEGTPGDERFPNCGNTVLASTYLFDVQDKMLVYIYTNHTTGCDAQGKKIETDNFKENKTLAGQILSTFKFIK